MCVDESFLVGFWVYPIAKHLPISIPYDYLYGLVSYVGIDLQQNRLGHYLSNCWTSLSKSRQIPRSVGVG